MVVAVGAGACGRGNATAGSGKPMIGFSLRFIAGNPWLSTLAKEAVKEGERRGYQVETQDATGDPVRQIQQMKTFINRGAKAIIIEPVADRALANGIAEARKANIPVIVVNDRVADDLAKQVACNVHDDALSVAALVGKYTAKVADERVPKGQPIKLYVQAIFPQELVTQTRDDGFMNGWNEYFKGSDRKTVKLPYIYGKAQPDATLQAMRATLSAHPDVNVVYNESDIVWGAILQSLTEQGLMAADGKTSVIGAGFDGDMDVVSKIGTPNYLVVANGINEPRTQAGYAIDEAIAAGKKEKTGKCDGTPPSRVLEPKAVTLDNAKEYVDPSSPYAYGKS
jgi:ribose transport system substrate-binding protein